MTTPEAGWIKIEASEVDFGYCYFNATIQHDSIRTHVCFYNAIDVWRSFGNRLQAFPQKITSVEEFYVEMDIKFGLKASCYNQQGHTAIQVLVDKRAIVPGPYRLEFAIPAEAASINYFGRILSNWQVEHGSSITWKAQTS